MKKEFNRIKDLDLKYLLLDVTGVHEFMEKNWK